MKKLKILLLSLVILSLASCGGNDEKPLDSTEPIVNPSEDINKPTDETETTTESVKDTFTVRFITNTDLVIENQILKGGSKIQKPIDPSKEGYDFIGWYMGEDKWSFDIFPVLEDITLEAKFKEKTKYKVSINNGTETLVKDYYYGDEIILETPQREFYEFLGWYDKNIKITNPKIIVKEDINITSKWKYLLTDFEVKKLEDGTTEIVKYIGKDTNVIIPEKIASIGDKAFYGCSNLESIKIPNSVTNIGDSAFENCTKLTDITIPNSVTSIGDSAFKNCTKLTDITIPNSVTSIDDSTFENCSMLTSIAIPDSVTSIGIGAFRKCISLVSVSLSEGLTNIGSSAFAGCNKLTNIIIPSSVTKIESSAFSDCRNLVTIVIPKEVSTIYENAFLYCGLKYVFYTGTKENWKNLTINSGNDRLLKSTIEYESLINEIEVVSNDEYKCIKKNNNELILLRYYLRKPTCLNLDEKFIGYENIVIAANAFEESDNLISISMSDVVKSIGDNAFKNCYNLVCAILPEGLTSIGYSLFSGCHDLISLKIPSSVKAIGYDAFSNCDSLEYVFYTGEKEAFDNITIAYGNSRLLNTTKLYDSLVNELILVENEKYKYITTNTNELIFLECKDKSIIAVDFANEFQGYKIIAINQDAFDECSSLTSVVIPNGVIRIGQGAFRDCSSLISVAIPNSVIRIDGGAFSNCSSLTSVAIPNTITSIGEYAFDRCSSLTYAFYSGTKENWKSINIEAQNENLLNSKIAYESLINELILVEDEKYKYITTNTNELILLKCKDEAITGFDFRKEFAEYENIIIGNSAFSNCSKLTYVIMSEVITCIGDRAFENCSMLTSITLPNSLISVGKYAFGERNFVDYIFYAGTKENWDNLNAATGNYIRCYEIEYETLVDEFTLVNNDKYKYITTNTNELILIDCNDTAITSFDSEKEFAGYENIILGASAFARCSSLQSVILSNAVTRLENRCFQFLQKLTDITIPNSVTYIGDSVFECCISLRSIIIPNSVNRIESSTFNSCQNLISIAIPKSVTSICVAAFVSCASLAYVSYEGTQANWNDISIENSNEYLVNAIIDYESSVNEFTLVDNEKYSYLITNTNKLIFLECKDKTITSFDFKKELAGYEIISIGVYAFDGCSRLTGITIPNSVKSIKRHAFDGCSSLTSITIPKSVTNIESYAFDGCGKLTINCEVEAKPDSWSRFWNYSKCPVNWGYIENN